MASIGYSQLLARFQPVPLDSLKLLTNLIEIDELFTQQSQQPENLSENLYDPNDFYIEPKTDNKKKTSSETKQKQVLLIGKAEEKKEVAEQKKKNYKPGPFASFYELNQGNLDKEAEVWYYKEGKNIVGPVSSYNMDKLVYYKKLDDETRVAFKGVDKFVKLGKIRKIVNQEKKEQ